MKASELAALLRERMQVDFEGPGDALITSLAYHSGKVSPGALFAALHGAKDDGVRYAGEALQRGASALLHRRDARDGLPPAPGVALLGVDDVRLALAWAAHAFWGRPSERMTLIGVTGTNGKTTLTWLVEAMARAAGMPCGVIGTIEYRLGERRVAAERTTPEAPDLQETLAWMASAGAAVAVMEVSSHALDQRRVDATRFGFAVFTNLSLDHLDYHGDMESYYQAKRRLFTDFPLQAALVNLDDPWGRRLAGEIPGEVITWGEQPDGHIRRRDVAMDASGISMALDVPGGELRLRSPLLGMHNAQNVTAAAAVGWRLGLPEEAIRAGIAAVGSVPGRFQKVPGGPGSPLVVVDYAHTPDALGKLLEAARGLARERLILVFGAGGDRDRSKRPLMGAVAAAGADLAFITSDNPRSEDPSAIIAAIEDGYREAGGRAARVEPDRRRAIFEAVAAAGPGDVVAIAGKGHETYQEVMGAKVHFDDREVAAEALAAREGVGR